MEVAEIEVRTCPQGIVLPLDLLAFSGRAEAKHNVLDWTTADEEDFSHFEVERSSDGNSGWSDLGAVAGAMEGTEEQGAYTFTDEQPLGQAYYRLKMTDLDGTFSYSELVYLEGADVQQLPVFPNPSTGRFTVTLPGITEATITLLDVSGRRIWTRSSVDMSAATPFDITSTPGVYMLLVTDAGGEQWVERVVVR